MCNKPLLLATLVLLGMLIAGCENTTSANSNRSGLPIPPKGFVADARQGAQLFRQNCSICHGENARGSTNGPPLIHRIYEPGHHADLAFYLAARNGTRQHHWQFGDMQPVKTVTPEEVGHIVGYIRAEQRRAGIYN